MAAITWGLRKAVPLILRRSLVNVLPIIVLAVFALSVTYVCAYRPGTVRDDDIKGVVPPLNVEGPVNVKTFFVRPVIVIQGQVAQIILEICNDSEKPVTVQMYIGAELADGSQSLARVDILTKTSVSGDAVVVDDSESGRSRRIIEPGCERGPPLEPPRLRQLPPNTWRLNLHLVVMATNQDISIASDTFEVRAGQ